MSAFDVEPAKVVVIPHGAAVAAESGRAIQRRELLTWGLLGPGRGSSGPSTPWLFSTTSGHARDLSHRWRHAPKVAAAKGDAYRDMLRRRVMDAGLERSVCFDGGYRGSTLWPISSPPSVVVLPYDSPDQVTSGVLVDAVAAGRPVVATAFPPLVSSCAAPVRPRRPRRDPAALATALRRVLTEPGLAEAMAAEARRLAPTLAWPAVASLRGARRPPARSAGGTRMTPDTGDFRHLVELTDHLGTFEHARYAKPRRADGYCTDDIAATRHCAAGSPTRHTRCAT